MILKLERQQKQNVINRWMCYPYVTYWKWDNREFSLADLEKDNYYDEVIYDIIHYPEWSRETKMNFTWITFVTDVGNIRTPRCVITTHKAFMMNDDGKTIENM